MTSEPAFSNSKLIVDILHAHLPNAQIRLSDSRGDGRTLALEIISHDFDNLLRLEQQRLVLTILNQAGIDCDTLSIRTLPVAPRRAVP